MVRLKQIIFIRIFFSKMYYKNKNNNITYFNGLKNNCMIEINNKKISHRT